MIKFWDIQAARGKYTVVCVFYLCHCNLLFALTKGNAKFQLKMNPNKNANIFPFISMDPTHGLISLRFYSLIFYVYTESHIYSWKLL